MNDKGHWAGFTLVELMVTLLLAAIVLGYGVPAFRNLILNNRQAAHMNNILTSVMLARSEALKRHHSVTVCKSANNSSCATAGGWEQGWIVFDDPNKSAIVDIGETVIRAFQGFANDATLRGNANIRNNLTYELTGFVTQAGQFVYCDSRVQNPANDAADVRVLVVSMTGQAKIVVPAVGAVNSCLSP
ncbi:MAG: GspH/FimT family pseudopilin [Methylococcaceae bacterium]|nr:GspH/FimT family pseudopilin [Methylococcaceae bacterium]